jgi:uncharacterized protein (DUF2147 family)
MLIAIRQSSDKRESMMKPMMAIVPISIIGLLSGPTVAQTSEEAFGVWLNPENQSQIEMYKCGGEGLCAKIVKVSDPKATDDKNPDPAKRSRPTVGLVIMENAKRSGSGKWNGILYNPTDGKSYSGSVTVKGKDTLDLSGCVAVVLCKTTTWSRVR